MRLHIVIILVCAGIFHLLPFFVSGIPLNHQLLSDVEQRLAMWQDTVTPGIFDNDQILTASLRTLPPSERFLSACFVSMARFVHLDIYTWSVVISLLSSALFLCGMYFLLFSSLRNRLFAFLITLFCIIPIHCLSGDTLGFQALGFLPRDLASGIGLFMLAAYFYALNKNSGKILLLVFLSLGLCANIYFPLFFSLFLTLLLSEIFRLRKITARNLLQGACFFAGAIPTLAVLVLKKTPSAVIDTNLLHLYYNYMMVYPFTPGVFKYLRRFLLYAILVPFAYFGILRRSPPQDQKLLRPWYAINTAALVLSVSGIFIETFTTQARFFLSRSSNWFMLSSMVIILYGVSEFFRARKIRASTFWTVAVAGVIFLGQSNAATVSRFLRNVRYSQEEKRDFFTAADKLKKLTLPGDVILTPSNEIPDIGTSVRAYAERPLYVCYKYGGVAILDGTIARQWHQRHSRVKDLFDNFTARSLFDLMKSEGIHYAFFPVSYYLDNEGSLKMYLIAQTAYYAIIKYP